MLFCGSGVCIPISARGADICGFCQGCPNECYRVMRCWCGGTAARLNEIHALRVCIAPAIKEYGLDSTTNWTLAISLRAPASGKSAPAGA